MIRALQTLAHGVLVAVLAGAAVQAGGASSRSFQGTQGGRAIAVGGGQSHGVADVLDGATHNNPYDNLNMPMPFPDAGAQHIAFDRFGDSTGRIEI